ncbi:acyl-CoA reductase [Neobacillus sp. SM06]|uniref:acyl-CoA reductase n=1 Tax=Neobacillus sp. SM06 TaxID=3422492 RepID=UPI003D2AC7F9
MEVIKAYWIPKSVDLPDVREQLVDSSCKLVFPVLTNEKIQEIALQIQQNRLDYLAQLTTEDIVKKIDQTVQKWLDPNYPFRKQAETLIPKITGYDPEMVRLELKKYMRTFRKKELLRFLDEEFDQPAMLDEFRPRKTGGMSRAYGPRSIFHVFSGNVPGVQIWSLIMGLLLKSANLGKTSTAEPLLPVLFSQSLAEVDPQLAETVAILPWKGGMTELEKAAVDSSEAVIVYGSDKAVKAVRQLVPLSKKFLTYGHKISLAVIGKEALTPDHFYETVHKLAEDVSIYDQQSCLSPQSVLVEAGGAISPQQFAQLLAAELDRYAKKRPRASITDEEAMSIRNLRNQAELESLENPKISLYASQEDTSWTVVYHDEPGFAGSPLNRFVHVFASEKLESDLSKMQQFEKYLQSCGLAVSPDRLFFLADFLGSLGVNRLSPIGQMNSAKPGWHHDGRFNLIDLLRFTDIERGLEEGLEWYDPDVE